MATHQTPERRDQPKDQDKSQERKPGQGNDQAGGDKGQGGQQPAQPR